MAIFSSSVICATNCLARLSGDSAVFIHGRSPVALTSAPAAALDDADACAGAASDARTSANTPATLTALSFPTFWTFIGYSVPRRIPAHGGASLPAAAGRQKRGEQIRDGRRESASQHGRRHVGRGLRRR